MGIKTETKPALSDTHAHLHFEHFADDLPRVVRRAQEAGVRKILTLGTDLPSSQESLQIADRFKEVYAAVGIHPTEVYKTSPEDIPVIKELANSQEKVVAIGEIGLDLYWKEVSLTDQLPVLERMLEIAQELDLPVQFHDMAPAAIEWKEIRNRVNRMSMRDLTQTVIPALARSESKPVIAVDDLTSLTPTQMAFWLAIFDHAQVIGCASEKKPRVKKLWWKM